MSEVTITLDSRDEAILLFGSRDQYLKEIRAALGMQQLAGRGDQVLLKGSDDQIDLAQRAFAQLRSVLRQQGSLTAEDVKTVLEVVTQGGDRIPTASPEKVAEGGGRYVKPRTDGQGRYVRAMREHDCTICVGPAGTGKCVAEDTLVLTGEGLVPIGELGRDVPPEAYRSRPTKVAGIDGHAEASHVYNGGLSPTVRIRTRHGFELEGTPEHPVLTLGPDGYCRWKPLEQVGPGDHVALARGTNLFGTETSVDFRYQRKAADHSSRPVTLERLDEEFAYFMGLLVGDGCVRVADRITFSSADGDLRAAVEAVIGRWSLKWIENPGRPYDMIICGKQLRELLAHLGMAPVLAHEKQVPRSILRAPREQVVAFLQGLYDTDGTVCRNGYPSLSTSSPLMARQVQLLLLNLGVVVSIHRKPTHRRTSYVVSAYGAEASRFVEAVGFRLKRKAERVVSRRHNTNLDVLPNVGPLLDAAVREHVFSRPVHKEFYDYRIGRRAPSHEKLGGLLTHFCQPHAAIDQLQWLVEHRFLWTEVTEIEESTAQVYDLTVPGDHSFVAGGIVNHNTYLAVGMAVSWLRQGAVKKICLVRPAVEAGERLGYLPGDMVAKINPYLRPLLDSLNDLMEPEQVKRYMENDVIEVCPLAYMRGRAQPLTSKVLTPQGFALLGTIRPGDLVIGSDGRPTRVLGVYPQGMKDVYKVTTTDGAVTRCCGEHLWSVFTPDDRRRGNPARTLQTREMIGNLRWSDAYRYELPLFSAPVEFPERDVPKGAYGFGRYLSGHDCYVDGEMAFARGRTVLGVLALNGPVPKPRADELLTQHGRSTTDELREFYLFASVEVRVKLLQGVLDRSGEPRSRDGLSSYVAFSTSSYELAESMTSLVRSLGGVACHQAADHGTHHLTLTLPFGVRPFRDERKAARYEEGGVGRPMRHVASIEPDGTEECVCIRVEAADSLYATDDFILTHNTLNSAAIILDEGQNTTVPQMKMFLTRMGNGSKIIVTGDVTQIDLPPHTRSGLIDAVGRLKSVERISLVHLDETDIVRNPLVQAILRAYEDDRPRKRRE